MGEALKLAAALVNDVHDILIKLFQSLGYDLSDKQLHFIIVAFIGIIIFFVVYGLFKFLARYSITAIAFIYTFTVLLVLVFGLEIEQKITKRGNMEFNDIVAGLWGFIEIFIVYLLIRLLIYTVKRVIRLIKEKP